MGVDLSMPSASKYMNGHSDVTPRHFWTHATDRARRTRAEESLGGFRIRRLVRAWRALKTLPLRMARHNANGMAVATALEGHRESGACTIRAGNHIRPRDCQQQMTGFGGMVCLDVEGGEADACRTFDRSRDYQARGEPRRCRERPQSAVSDVAGGHTDEQRPRPASRRQ